jgi:hypothetical protein
MIKQTVVWTAIPNGRVANNALRLVCLVSPRLSRDAAGPATLTLGLFQDWKNWATTLASVKFGVSINGTAAIAATTVSDPPEPELWDALFAPGTFVRPFQFTDHSTRNVRSYPVGNVVDAISKQYRETLAEWATSFPPAASLVEKGLSADIGFPRPSGASEAAHLNQLDARFTASVRALPPEPADPLWDFLQVKRFHKVRTAPPVPPKATREELDFHQVLAMLMEYPAIQRRLGLVVDLTVPLPGGLGANPTISVVPTWTSAQPGTLNRTPVTLATFGSGVFAPRAGGELSHDRLNLAGAAFRVVAMDVDGAALKARQFADTVRRAWTIARSADTPDRYALPALRSGGLAVVRTGSAVRQVARFADATTKNGAIVSGATLNLDAEALLRGFRWHVYDVHSGRWYSLCQRTGGYHFITPNRTLPVVNPEDSTVDWEEGVITAAATQRVDGSPLDFYQAEYLCRWHGESLVAPRPGKSLHRDPGSPPELPSADPPAAFPLSATFRPQPGSLPPLRFGRTYRLRAFAGYVGGAGPAFVDGDTSADFSTATAEWTYARLEPVAPPEVVMRRSRTAGESLHHLVIRTNWDSAAADTAAVERHLLPPRTSQLQAEQHGMFDTPTGLDPNAYDMICARAPGELTGGVPDPANSGQPYYDVDVLSFPVEGTNTAQLPWLADPFARGAALYGLPGLAPGETKRVDFGPADDWPSMRPLRLRLVEGSGSPVPIAGSGRGLEVRLGKGDVAEVELSSYLLDDDLRQLQVWRWFAHEATPPYSPALVATRRKEALDGRVWLLTPKQKLVLVCATREPLAEPRFQAPQVVRQLDQNHAIVSDTLKINRKSTGSVELRAEWTDPVDDLTGSIWEPAKQVVKTADLGETRVAKTPVTDTLPVSHRHDFSDTKYHRVTYTAVAKSRFAEYFAERRKVTLTGTTAVVLDSRGVSRHCEEVVPAGGDTRYVRGTDYDMDYLAGTIRRSTGSHIPDGGQVEVGFLPPISRQSAPADPADPADPARPVTVLSTARPAPPQPLYVVPTFGWDVQRPSQDPVLAGDVLSRRRGNGLRVYLDRPWWSSGGEEQLAVVLLNPAELTDELRPYITAWGMDPVFHSTPMSQTLPQQANFVGASKPGPLPLAERSTQQVTIAAYPVVADLRRTLWYCDLELTAGTSYFPFVRLALARYQPNAMAGVELSRVALADFAQLAPDRWVSLSYVPNNDIRITVIGHSYLATAGSAINYSRLSATLERRDPNIPGELGWVPAGEFPLSDGAAFTGGRTSWIRTIHLPVPRGSEPMRIVIREYERFTNNSAGERLVFTDTVEIL